MASLKINRQENSLTFVHQLIPVTAYKTTECTELLPLIVMLSEWTWKTPRKVMQHKLSHHEVMAKQSFNRSSTNSGH
jgi:hypothetical protein